MRLVWRALVERLEDLSVDDDKRRAVLTANKLGLVMGGGRRK